MPGLFTTQTVSILPATQQNPGATKSLAAQIQGATRGTDVEQFGNMAGRAVQNIQDQVNTIMNALRSPLPFPNTIAITDERGNVVGLIGITPDNPNPIWVESLGISGTPTIPFWDFETQGDVFGSLPGGNQIVLNLTPTPHPQITVAGSAGENIAVASNEIIAIDTSLNSATLTPTSLVINNTTTGDLATLLAASLTINNGTAQEIFISDSTIQQTIASALTAQIQTQSWFNELAVGGTGPIAPTFLSLNDGTTRISFPSGDLLLIDDTHFLQFADVTGEFTQLTPTGILTQNAAATRFTSLSNAGAVSGQSVGTTTFLLNGNSLKVSNLPSASPGAGSKQFFYDPADGNRVKYAP